MRPKGQSLAKLPDIAAQLDELGGDDGDSPVMARAPLLLKESLLFPYREGLNFEQVVLKDQGPNQAFAGALDRPPGTSYEIMHPRAWERQVHPPLLTMPDIHPLIDAAYAPYDIGVMGALDVRILTELFAGKDEAAQLTPEWDGGIYYAAQSRAAKTPEEKDSTKSVALLYLSQWKSEDAAARFAAIYADNLKRKYTDVHLQPKDESEGRIRRERVYDRGGSSGDRNRGARRIHQRELSAAAGAQAGVSDDRRVEAQRGTAGADERDGSGN